MDRYTKTIWLIVFLFILTGCSTMNTREKGAMVGMGTGAGVGALAGRAFGGSTGATVIGAGIGAVSGLIAGDYIGDGIQKRDQQLYSNTQKINNNSNNIVQNNSRINQNQNKIQTVEIENYQNLKENIQNQYDANVFFDFNSDVVTIQSYKKILKVCNILKKYPDLQVQVAGHADDTGKKDYNYRLAHLRALAVRNVLIEQGVNPDRIIVSSYGSNEPLAQNNAMNRRATIVFL